jgi:uncharacterized protein YkwD
VTGRIGASDRYARLFARTHLRPRFRLAMTRNSLVGVIAAVSALLTVLLPAQPVVAMDASMAGPGEPSFILLVSAEQALIDLTNADRTANGVAPVQFDAATLVIARERAEMQLGKQSLNHYDNDGHLVFAQLLTQGNLPYGLAGENLARAASSDSDVTMRVEQALMQSPTHRKNILEAKFRKLAIGAATDTSTGQIAFAEVYRD